MEALQHPANRRSKMCIKSSTHMGCSHHILHSHDPTNPIRRLPSPSIQQTFLQHQFPNPSCFLHRLHHAHSCHLRPHLRPPHRPPAPPHHRQRRRHLPPPEDRVRDIFNGRSFTCIGFGGRETEEAGGHGTDIRVRTT